MEMLLNYLESRLGCQAQIEGGCYELVEILSSEQAVVLCQQDCKRHMQHTLHGAPRYRVARTITLPVLSSVSGKLHPSLQGFVREEDRQQDSLQPFL